MNTSLGKKKDYDVIIIGGGISGLYVAYKLLRHFSKYGDGKSRKKILILEKSDVMGGRIFTYSDKSMTVDAGAGRFSADHQLFISLLKDLGLYGKKSKNGNSVAHCYIDPSGKSHIMNSILDYDYNRIVSSSSIKNTPSFSKVMMTLTTDMVLDTMNKSSLPNVGLVARVLAVGAVTPRETLIRMSFLDFARTVLTADEIDFLVGSFGYYSELVIMNAYDCMKLMLELNPSHTFYSLRGGLSLVTEELARRIRELGGDIVKKRVVEKIVSMDDGGFIVSGSGPLGGHFSFTGEKVVCAVLKKDLMRFPIFRPINGLVEGILTAPLCRVYARYSVCSGGVWFRGLPKLTVNNELRMIIPISEKEGIIMITYSDNKFADYWKKVFDRGGEAGLNRRLKKKVFDALVKEIPDAEEIRLFYWPSGVGYWGVGADSALVSRAIVQPFVSKNLFVCGENFSDRYQQWMEGSLETGARVVERIISV